VGESGESPSFWVTVPGLITALATLLTAVVGAYVVLRQLDSDDESSPAIVSGSSAVPTTGGSESGPIAGWRDGGGDVVMRPGAYVDLDTGTVGSGPSRDAEIYWDPDDGKLKALSPGSALIEGLPSSWIASCRAELHDESATEVFVDELVPGDWLCARTDTGAVSVLGLTRIDLGAPVPEIRLSAEVA
jgi:hypothetical protein